jgi:hypothetical protein
MERHPGRAVVATSPWPVSVRDEVHLLKAVARHPGICWLEWDSVLHINVFFSTVLFEDEVP